MLEGGLATTTYYGTTKLTSTIDDSETLAATPKAVNTVNTALATHIATVANTTVSAHVKLSDDENNSSLTAAAGGTAATPAALAKVYDRTNVYYVQASEVGTNSGFVNALNAYTSGRKVVLKLEEEGSIALLLPLLVAHDEALVFGISAGPEFLGLNWSSTGEVEEIASELVDINSFSDLEADLASHKATSATKDVSAHVKLSDIVSNAQTAAHGIAATPKMVYDALEDAKEDATQKAGQATEDANTHTDTQIEQLVGPVAEGHETLSGLEAYIDDQIASTNAAFNGYVPKTGNSTITGSLTVSGSVTASNFTGSLTGNASTATTATKLGTSAGDTNNPVYFSEGKPLATVGFPSLK